MPEALRRLSAIAPVGPPAGAPETWLTSSLPPATRFAFHGNAAARVAATAAWEVGFSEHACRALSDDHRATLWLGPDEYLLLKWAANATEASSASANEASSLERALTGQPHALVDISHRQLALIVGGPHAADILNGACPLDLHLAAFPVGMCTRTVFAKADIVLWRRGADTFHVEVWRSFAGYVTGILREVASEFYPGA